MSLVAQVGVGHLAGANPSHHRTAHQIAAGDRHEQLDADHVGIDVLGDHLGRKVEGREQRQRQRRPHAVPAALHAHHAPSLVGLHAHERRTSATRQEAGRAEQMHFRVEKFDRSRKRYQGDGGDGPKQSRQQEPPPRHDRADALTYGTHGGDKRRQQHHDVRQIEGQRHGCSPAPILLVQVGVVDRAGAQPGDDRAAQQIAGGQHRRQFHRGLERIELTQPDFDGELCDGKQQHRDRHPQPVMRPSEAHQAPVVVGVHTHELAARSACQDAHCRHRPHFELQEVAHIGIGKQGDRREARQHAGREHHRARDDTLPHFGDRAGHRGRRQQQHDPVDGVEQLRHARCQTWCAIGGAGIGRTRS